MRRKSAANPQSKLTKTLPHPYPRLYQPRTIQRLSSLPALSQMHDVTCLSTKLHQVDQVGQTQACDRHRRPNVTSRPLLIDVDMSICRRLEPTANPRHIVGLYYVWSLTEGCQIDMGSAFNKSTTIRHRLTGSNHRRTPK